MNRWLLLWFWWPFLAGAQPSVAVNGTPTWTQPVDIASHTLRYDDLSGMPLPFNTVRQQVFRPFVQQRLEQIESASTVPAIVSWLQFRVQNTSQNQPANVLFQVGRQGQIDLFSEQGVHLQQTGTYQMAYNVRQWQPLRLRILPGQTSTFFVKITNYVRVVDPITATLHTPTTLTAWFALFSYETRWLFMGLMLVASSLFVMGFFALSQFTFNRDLVFLYYGLFSLATLIVVLWNMNFRLGLGLPMPTKITTQYFTPTISLFYVLFISKFIELPTAYPKVWAILKVFIVLFICQQLMIFYEFKSGLLFRRNWFYLGQEVTLLIAGLILFFCLIWSKSPFKRYILAGIGCLWTISCIHMFVEFRLDGGNRAALIFVNYVPLMYALGAMFENFCFLLALAYRNKLVEIEKNQIQVDYTYQLEEKLRVRTIEIELQTKLLETIRVKQLERDFNQRLADSEMTALRAQMNPHFIFNCLNSIKLYTLQNNTDKASDYLTKFARLIRLVLENSRADRITLEHELDALQLYIDLEGMRFKHKVAIGIRVAADIDQQFVQIPPLLIQPYVENAIWHGLMHKPEGGTVSIDVTQPTDGQLRVAITDDGIGRARAAELKSKSAGKTKSFGMQVTADRIRMINQLYHVQTQATIYDLVAPNGDAVGTKVVLEIPV